MLEIYVLSSSRIKKIFFLAEPREFTLVFLDPLETCRSICIMFQTFEVPTRVLRVVFCRAKNIFISSLRCSFARILARQLTPVLLPLFLFTISRPVAAYLPCSRPSSCHSFAKRCFSLCHKIYILHSSCISRCSFARFLPRLPWCSFCCFS